MNQDQERPKARIADAVRERGGEDHQPVAETVFRLDDVHVYYGGFLALRGVNLEIGQNEITAFIGRPGAARAP